MSTETSTIHYPDWSRCTTSIKKGRIVKEIGKIEGSRKGRMRSCGIIQAKQNTKRREHNFTYEALALLNHLKLLMNLWRDLISALDREFKTSKKPLLRILNFN